MSKAVQVPDPVYERIEREAESDDVAMGVVVRDWMEAADKLEERELR